VGSEMCIRDRVWDDYDPLTGFDRDDVIISPEDARRLGLRPGDPVLLRSEVGEFRGKARIADVAPRNLEVHWPGANTLIRIGHVDPSCGEPDYNAVCELVPLGADPRISAGPHRRASR